MSSFTSMSSMSSSVHPRLILGGLCKVLEFLTKGQTILAFRRVLQIEYISQVFSLSLPFLRHVTDEIPRIMGLSCLFKYGFVILTSYYFPFPMMTVRPSYVSNHFCWLRSTYLVELTNNHMQAHIHTDTWSSEKERERYREESNPMWSFKYCKNTWEIITQRRMVCMQLSA